MPEVIQSHRIQSDSVIAMLKEVFFGIRRGTMEGKVQTMAISAQLIFASIC